MKLMILWNQPETKRNGLKTLEGFYLPMKVMTLS
jgi:hypothetical protein